MPLDLYRTIDAPIIRGVHVEFCPPPSALFDEASRRGYLHAGFCPGDQWPARIAALVAAGDYGAREDLLRCANLLLGEQPLCELVSFYEQQLVQALAKPQEKSPGRSNQFDRQSSTASSALNLLVKALRDPDLSMRTLVCRSPSPNPLQKEKLVRAYLTYGRAEAALPWLDEPWGHMQSSRQHLLAEVLPLVGCTKEAEPTAHLREHPGRARSARLA